MRKIISLEYRPSDPTRTTQKLEEAFANGFWVELLDTSDEKVFIANNQLPIGPGIIIRSSGSTGGHKKCLHPSLNMNQSALATGQWLMNQGIQPKNCQILNGLPLNHVSGLMPWWRSKEWNAQHTWLSPALMRNPLRLESYCQSFFRNTSNSLLTSLVPTQLKRLLDHPAGIRWLKAFSVIWIGGSSLTEQLAQCARSQKIRLAPCYGTSETMAMVTALFPDEFLRGRSDCGLPLQDVELRLSKSSNLEIRTSRIGSSIDANGKITEITNNHGWWKSGDSAKLIQDENQLRVHIIGRTDTAIHSGGETIFPERLQERLLQEALKNHIPIKSILLLGTPNEEWGERLIALVRLSSESTEKQSSKIFISLKNLVKQWPPAAKPIEWYQCPQLSPNSMGKWEVKKWREWVLFRTPIIDR